MNRDVYILSYLGLNVKIKAPDKLELGRDETNGLV